MPSKPALWDQIVANFQRGNFGLAEKGCVELLRMEPRHVPGLHLLSVIAGRRNNAKLEENYLQKILAIDPGHVGAVSGLANLLRSQGKVQEALELCRRALEIQPKYLAAHNTLGLCLLTLGRPSEAAKSFELALRFDAQFEPARKNLQIAKLKLAQNPNEVGGEQVIQTAQDYIDEAFLKLHELRRQEAMDLLDKAIELDPMSVRALLLQAQMKRSHGHSEEAVELIRRALEIDDSVNQIHLLLGFLLEDLGRFDEAKISFEKCLQLVPKQGQAYLGLALGQKFKDGDEPFVEHMKALLNEGLPASEKILIHTALSKVEDDLANYERAVSHMDEANRLANVEIGLMSKFDATTNRKQLEACMRACSADWIEKSKAFGLVSELPVLFVGLPRSGTSLLEQILAGHPEIAAGGELQFWGDVSGLISGFRTGESPNIDEIIPYGTEYLKILEGIGPKAARITDKMPVNFVYIGLIHAILPKARFIHCRRGALDNCISLYMTPFHSRPPFCYSREDIIAYRQTYVEIMEYWRSVVPPELILDVDYENVVANKEEEARRVIDFLGLDWNDACLQHEKLDRAVHTPSNWQTRQAIYKTSVERWHRYEPWLGAFKQLIPETKV